MDVQVPQQPNSQRLQGTTMSAMVLLVSGHRDDRREGGDEIGMGSNSQPTSCVAPALAYWPNSAISNVAGSIPLVLIVASPLVLARASAALSPSSNLPISLDVPSLRRAAPRSARLRKLKRPSPPCVGDGDVVFERIDLLNDGVRSFHAATILRTEVSGERGEVCGRRREDAVGVAVVVKPVNVGV